MKNWEQRIHSILSDDNERTPDNVRRHLDHLRHSLKLPLRVTGVEDFPWEEPYVFGAWSQAEYRRLKKTQPSYTDKFDLLDLAETEEDDLIARIRRISDGRELSIGLSWLKSVDRKVEGFTVLEDYATWYTDL